MKNHSDAKLKAIDFFCGGGGMTNGLIQAGITVIAGLDYDVSCQKTYESNNKGARFLHSDITKYEPKELMKDTNIQRNDNNLIFIGCSPCQYWSIIQTNKSKSQKTKNLIHDFMRFVEYFKPGIVVVENVPGILNKKNESLLHEFIHKLEGYKYRVHYDIVNMNHYGVPQSRKRFSLIASRVGEVQLPKKDEFKSVVNDFIGEHNGFGRIEAGHNDKSDFQHSCSRLTEINLERIKKTKKNGGSRLDWKDNSRLQLNAYRGKDKDFTDNYGRMKWDKPSPTITTKFHSLSNGRFGHPEENRAISIREGATLQTFPSDYIFYDKSIICQAKMIGNAVPPEYAKRIGQTIKETLKHDR